MTPEIFRYVLQYIYGGGAPDEETAVELGVEIIDAADRYGVVGLKMDVERQLVASRVIDLDNVVEYLVFADAKNWPLLKEYALAYFVSRAKDVLRSDTSKLLKESTQLMEELMLLINEKVDDNPYIKATGFGTLSVDALRKKLQDEYLDVDGTKDTLIARLENARKRQRTK